MTRHEAWLKYRTFEEHVSGYCCDCGLIVPIKRISCAMEVDLNEAAESDQLKVSMYSAFPYTSGENINQLYMGIKCRICGKPMALVDSDIAKYLYQFNHLKLFTIFSCEGHYERGVDCNTGLSTFVDCSTPYISFIGNGQTLQDILLFNIQKNGGEIRKCNDHEYSVCISDDPGKEWTHDLFYLKWDKNLKTLYALFDSMDRNMYKKAKFTFEKGLCTLLKLLPQWIRDWYNECKDDGECFVDTEKKKAEYQRVWANNISPEEIIQNYENGGYELDGSC